MRRVRGGTDPPQARAPESLADHTWALVTGGQQAEVDLVPLDARRQLIRWRTGHDDLDCRVHLGDAGQDAGKPAQRVIVRRAEPHRAGNRRHPDGRDDLVMHRKRPSGTFEQPGTMRRWLDVPRAAQKQRLAQHLLEPPDLHRYGGIACGPRLRRRV